MFKIIASFTISLILVTWSSGSALADTKNYFPPGALAPSSTDSDSFMNAWFSEHLAAMSEPVLKPINGVRTYRFTWLRTFHHPVAVRIVATDTHVKLFATELDGAGGYDPGKVLRKIERDLTVDQSRKFDDLIQRSGFWSLPSHEKTSGLDGSKWILEGVTDKYHVVVRWMPESGPVREIGEQFLSLAGWRFGSKEFY